MRPPQNEQVGFGLDATSFVLSMIICQFVTPSKREKVHILTMHQANVILHLFLITTHFSIFYIISWRANCYSAVYRGIYTALAYSTHPSTFSLSSNELKYCILQ